MNLIKTLIAFALTVTSICALAQWQWIDKDGRKIFSDRGPGSDVPEGNILRRPAGSKPKTASSAAEGSGHDIASAASKAAGVDKALDAKKKQAEVAEVAKKKEDEERIARAKAENCKSARQSKATISSGVRLAKTNQAGEREILDETARAAEAQRVQSIIDAECK